MLAKHAEEYPIEYNQVRPHEAIAWNRPKEVHLGLADPKHRLSDIPGVPSSRLLGSAAEGASQGCEGSGNVECCPSTTRRFPGGAELERVEFLMGFLGGCDTESRCGPEWAQAAEFAVQRLVGGGCDQQ